MHVDRATFRHAMAQFGSAVSVVTTDGPGGQCGFTCTAVCSVTDEPATVLVCVHRGSRTNHALKANLVFCVNLLNAEQEEVSALFAGQAGGEMADRFKRVDWRTSKTGSPVFEKAVATLDCSVAEIKEFGTHSILFGRVRAAETKLESAPLMYFNRGYHALGRSVLSQSSAPEGSAGQTMNREEGAPSCQ